MFMVQQQTLPWNWHCLMSLQYLEESWVEIITGALVFHWVSFSLLNILATNIAKH